MVVFGQNGLFREEGGKLGFVGYPLRSVRRHPTLRVPIGPQETHFYLRVA